MPALPWFVYVVRCRDGTLYTGITTDVIRRQRQHNAGDAARFTRGRGPVTLVHVEVFSGRSAALRREFAVKRMPRSAKLRMIKHARDCRVSPR